MFPSQTFQTPISNEALGQTILYLIYAQVVLLAAADLVRVR